MSFSKPLQSGIAADTAAKAARASAGQRDEAAPSATEPGRGEQRDTAGTSSAANAQSPLGGEGSSPSRVSGEKGRPGGTAASADHRLTPAEGTRNPTGRLPAPAGAPARPRPPRRAGRSPGAVEGVPAGHGRHVPLVVEEVGADGAVGPDGHGGDWAAAGDAAPTPEEPRDPERFKPGRAPAASGPARK